MLFEARLAALRAKREGQAGLSPQESTTLVELVSHHLIMRARAGRTSDQHMRELETRLGTALKFFGRDRDPRTIEPSEVRAWSVDLAKDGTSQKCSARCSCHDALV